MYVKWGCQHDCLAELCAWSVLSLLSSHLILFNVLCAWEQWALSASYWSQTMSIRWAEVLGWHSWRGCESGCQWDESVGTGACSQPQEGIVGKQGPCGQARDQGGGLGCQVGRGAMLGLGKVDVHMLVAWGCFPWACTRVCCLCQPQGRRGQSHYPLV